MNTNNGNDIITVAINMIMATIMYNTSARTIHNTISSNINIRIKRKTTMKCINSLAITVNITSPLWACVGFCGPLWASEGLCGPLWASVGPCGPLWASCGSLWASVGLCGPLWACVYYTLALA